MYGISLLFWSLATALQGIATGFASLFAFRLGVGLMEGPAFPANTRAGCDVVSAAGAQPGHQYLPDRPIRVDRAVCRPAALATVTAGWRPMFYVTGGMGIVFGLVWLWLYRDPLQSRRANEAELRYIEEGGGLARNAVKSSATMAQVLELFRYRQIWAFCIGKFCSNTVLTFFLTWFPTYLLEERKITVSRRACSLSCRIWARRPGSCWLARFPTG